MIDAAQVLVPYDVYRADALDGDVLLWKPHDLIGELIARETNGPYCHASAVVFVHDRPFQSAYREGENGFLSPLSAEIRRNSGQIDVYRAPIDAIQRAQIRRHLLDDLGGDYAWANIQQFVLDASWFGRLFEGLPWFRARLQSRRASLERSRTSSICSQHVARAYGRGARYELCPQRSYSRTSPNDLARSPRLKYHATLTWPEGWKQ